MVPEPSDRTALTRAGIRTYGFIRGMGRHRAGRITWAQPGIRLGSERRGMTVPGGTVIPAPSRLPWRQSLLRSGREFCLPRALRCRHVRVELFQFGGVYQLG